MYRACTKLLMTPLLVLTILALFAPGSIGYAAQPHGVRSPAIDQVIQQVLLNIRTNGWNPLAQSHGQTVGGLYINWQMDNPSNRNAGATPVSNDPQVVLYYLNALAEYHTLHPEDHSFDTELQRALQQVLVDFAHYNVPKGWLYFYLLRDAILLQNNNLFADAYAIAANYYNNWYNPQFGLVYNRNANDYTVEHTLACGTALIDAGQRWGKPAWIAAGQSTLNNALVHAFNQRYHLFYHSMAVAADGTQTVEDDLAKATSQGMDAETLMNAYVLTHNQFYLVMAGIVLQTLLNGPLWDRTYGGLFFAFHLTTGKLEQAYKETRGQSATLIALDRYNKLFSQMGRPAPFVWQQQQLTNLLSANFYQSAYHGFFYRVTPTFQVYTSNPGQGIGYENFFTTEAMGVSMDALQQTEFTTIPL